MPTRDRIIGAMGCLDDEAALALGAEPLPPGIEAHLDECMWCRVLVAEVARGDDEPVPPPLLELEPGTRIGRFELGEELGAGASGVVFRARDPELGRDVALKLLHYRAGAGDEEQLLREARAMAKLAHPNLVPVYEVGRWEGSIFVAMELVAGGTLRAWLASPRTRADIIQRCLEVGRGLAAAHAAGLVHRDVKPENILVGEDGRARVTDLGLAGESDLGRLVGTPAYMAPEQLAGQGADARSDQFAYCMVVVEALAGVRPFPGAEREVLARPAGIPAKMWRALARGLSIAPADRFADVNALLAALAPRSRVAAIVVASAIVAAASIATAVLLASNAGGVPPPTPCSANAFASWNPLQREIMRAGFAGKPSSFEPVASALDRYASAWSVAHREACDATRRGDASAALLDRRMSCLGDRANEVAAVVGWLGRSRATDHAVSAIGALAAPRECDAPDDLADPVEPAHRAEATALRVQLAQNRALIRLALVSEALAPLNTLVARAEQLHLPRLRAEALMVRGLARMTARAGRDATSDLEEVVYAAEANKLDRLSALASSALLAASADAGDYESARRWLRSAKAAVERLGPAATAANSNLSARTAWLELKTGEYARAEVDARAAVATGCHGEVATTAACAHLDVLASVLASQNQLAEALELYRKNLALVTAQYGPADPTTARALERVASTLDTLGRPAEALPLFDHALEILGPADGAVRALVLGNSATPLMHLNRYPEAEARMRAALAVTERLLGSDHVEVATALVNLSNVMDRLGRDSLPQRQRALAIFEAKLGPEHPLVGKTLSEISYGYLTSKRPALAIPLLERACKIQLATLGAAHPEYAYTLALLGGAELDAKDSRAVTTLEAAMAAPGADPAGRADLAANLADAKRLRR